MVMSALSSTALPPTLRLLTMGRNDTRCRTAPLLERERMALGHELVKAGIQSTDIDNHPLCDGLCQTCVDEIRTYYMATS
jgi:hypothetical protein